MQASSSVMCGAARRRNAHSRPGFNLLELVVTLAILSILAAILIPAVGNARETMHRTSCVSNLRQIALAVTNYETAWGVYPNGRTWKYDILPYLDQRPVYDARLPLDTPLVDGNPWTHYEPIRGVRLPVYRCSSDWAPDIWSDGTANYAGCYGTGVLQDGFNGMFNSWGRDLYGMRPARPVRVADVRDGLSNTAMISEQLVAGNDLNATLRTVYVLPRTYDWSEQEALASACESLPERPGDYGYRGVEFLLGRPWFRGWFGSGQYNHVLPPNRPSCKNQNDIATGAYTASSLHPGGVNSVFADGHVEFVSAFIDRQVWRDAGSRVPSVLPGY